MNKYDYFCVLCGERKVNYHDNVYEVISETDNGVILQSVNDDTHLQITFRELRLNADVFLD